MSRKQFSSAVSRPVDLAAERAREYDTTTVTVPTDSERSAHFLFFANETRMLESVSINSRRPGIDTCVQLMVKDGNGGILHREFGNYPEAQFSWDPGIRIPDGLYPEIDVDLYQVSGGDVDYRLGISHREAV